MLKQFLIITQQKWKEKDNKTYPYNIIEKVETIPSNAYLNNMIPTIVRQKGSIANDLEPTYSEKEIILNDGMNGRPCWVTYRDGVYDITDFIPYHPGGEDFIRLAAGGAVDSFWKYWSAHHHSLQVAEQLEKCRIGKFKLDDDSDEVLDSPFYESEPPRSSHIQPLTVQPWDSQTESSILSKTYYTPSDVFYIRNHAPVPETDITSHTIEFMDKDGIVKCNMSIDTLFSKFKKKNVTSILQCAGNRAMENIEMAGQSVFSGTNGEYIDIGMVGNAKWGGVGLMDVLKDVYPDIQKIINYHIVFFGADGYFTSVPLNKIINSNRESECLLATEMNDEPLTPDHGYPIRVLLPGIIGARNVKWVTQIQIQENESDSCWNQNYYKQQITIQNKVQPSCVELPIINSMITSINNFDRNQYEIKGVAYNSEGILLKCIEISVDKGTTWSYVKNMKNTSSKFGWIQWSYIIKKNEIIHNEIWCRATDVNGNQQPSIGIPKRINVKNGGGYLYNGWHRKKILK